MLNVKTIEAEIENEIAEAKAAIEKLNEEIKNRSQQVFANAISKYFTAFPIVEYITWTQYTPGFNDGEPCEFGVNGPYIRLKGDPFDDEDDYDEGTYIPSEWSRKNYPKDAAKFDEKYGTHLNSIQKAKSVAESIIGCMDESVLNMMYGDGSKIKIYADRIDVTDYDCGY
jgi:hypothetical protein